MLVQRQGEMEEKSTMAEALTLYGCLKEVLPLLAGCVGVWKVGSEVSVWINVSHVLVHLVPWSCNFTYLFNLTELKIMSLWER